LANNSRIQKLKLTNYRNHEKLLIECKKNFIFLEGKNGSGKTNVLEAISLISSRSGFRNSEFNMVVSKKNKVSPEQFGANFRLESSSDIIDIGIGLKKQGETLQRITKVDGSNSTMNLDDIMKVFWILPTMNSIFVGPSKERRVFYDHMISLFANKHKKMIKEYNNLQQERIKILKLYSLTENNLKWLDMLEKKMSTLGILITENRISFIENMNDILSNENDHLPGLKINLFSGMSEKYNKLSALDLEEEFVIDLFKSRETDTKTGKTNISAIKSDFTVFHKSNKLFDKDCSTGEQKIILFSIIMSFIKLLKKKGEKNIIFLLDDIFSTLDSNYTDILLFSLNDLNVQTWLTDVKGNVIHQNHLLYKETMFINIEDINI
tara:strand:+ start:20417 stop:21553 length:1137 start_codon:yes stop_codon:yes gene_type:complete